MRRGEAWKPLREHGKWMRAIRTGRLLRAPRAFRQRRLLDTGAHDPQPHPARRSVLLLQVHRRPGARPPRGARLDHPQRTGKPATGNPAAVHKTTYQLDHGWLCSPDCKHRHAPKKGPIAGLFQEEKGSDSRTEKGSDSHPENRRSDPVSDEGIAAGREREGKREESRQGTTPEACWPDPDQHWLYGQPSGAMGTGLKARSVRTRTGSAASTPPPENRVRVLAAIRGRPR